MSTNKTLKVILIDPVSKTVSATEIEDGVKPLNDLIGSQCYAGAIQLPNNDYLYVDDEGLFNKENKYFQIVGGTAPLAGRGVLIGTGEEGESVNVKSTVEEIRRIVAFQRCKMNYRVEYEGLREGYSIEKTEEEVDDHIVFKNFTEAKSKAVENARSDVWLVQEALKSTKALKKADL